MEDITRMVQQLRDALDVMVTGLSEAQGRYVRAEAERDALRALLRECRAVRPVPFTSDLLARLDAALGGE